MFNTDRSEKVPNGHGIGKLVPGGQKWPNGQGPPKLSLLLPEGLLTSEPRKNITWWNWLNIYILCWAHKKSLGLSHSFQNDRLLSLKWNSNQNFSPFWIEQERVKTSIRFLLLFMSLMWRLPSTPGPRCLWNRRASNLFIHQFKTFTLAQSTVFFLCLCPRWDCGGSCFSCLGIETEQG